MDILKQYWILEVEVDNTPLPQSPQIPDTPTEDAPEASELPYDDAAAAAAAADEVEASSSVQPQYQQQAVPPAPMSTSTTTDQVDLDPAAAAAAANQFVNYDVSMQAAEPMLLYDSSFSNAFVAAFVPQPDMGAFEFDLYMDQLNRDSMS